MTAAIKWRSPVVAVDGCLADFTEDLPPRADWNRPLGIPELALHPQGAMGEAPNMGKWHADSIARWPGTLDFHGRA